MGSRAAPPHNAHIDVGISAPSLAWISVTLFVVAVFFIVAGILLIAIPMGRVARERTVGSPTAIC